MARYVVRMPNITIERTVCISSHNHLRFGVTLTGAEKDALTSRTRFTGVVSYPWDSSADPRPTPPGEVWAPWFTKEITFELEDSALAIVISIELAIGNALEAAGRAAIETILRSALAEAAASDQAQGEAEPTSLRGGRLGDVRELHALADQAWAIQKHLIGDAQARGKLREISATLHAEAEGVRARMTT